MAGDLGVGAFNSSFSTYSPDIGPFPIQYNPNGDRLWAKQEPDGVIDLPSISYGELEIDSADNVYISRSFSFESLPTVSVIKYDSSGNELESQSLSGNPFAKDIEIDNENNVYSLAITPEDYNPQWLYYYDAEPEGTAVIYKNENELLQLKNFTNLNDNPQLNLEEDREGNLYVSINTLNSEEYLSLAKYNKAAELIWELDLNSQLDYSGITVDSDGKVYLAGSTNDVLGETNIGGTDAWVVKLDINAAIDKTVNAGLTLDEGASSTITSSQLEMTGTGNSNYIITALPANGSLLLNNVEVTLNDTFTQADIDGGNLTYTHDGSETTNDSFSFTPPSNEFWLLSNRDFQIAVNPVNDAPTDITLSQNSIAENSATGTVIAQLTTTDNDSETHTYTLVNDAEARFVIEGNELKVADGSNLDFEAANSHTIKIRTVDNGEPVQSFEKEFNIELTDIEDNTVTSTTNYRLGATKENLNLVGEDAINGIGNNLDNRINGNNAKNRIWGKDGNDVLIGRGGNDTLIGDKGSDRLIGNQGNDLLNGGPGIDTMTGGPDNDTYIVNHTRDVVKEGRNRGTDVVKSSAGYNLGANVENLNLVGKSAINGVGNNLDNRIGGNNAKNRIIGKLGDDILIGRGGNDVLIGNEGSDRLIGNVGNDLLNGGVGNDTLIGGGGSDRFIFNTGKSYRKAAPGKDLIRDFKNRDNDRIILDKTTFGALDSKAGRGFSVIAEFDVVNRDAAVASSDAVIVYNENNGKLFYNANGSNSGLGAGGVFAVLDNSPQLEANDFIVRG
jgi:Ca2+-binding RTX toxin-like protein